MTRNLDPAFLCKVHPLPMLVTQSKLQRVCQVLGCDEHVRLSGPLKPDKETDMSPKDQPLATVTNPNDKKAREKAIAEAAAKKKAQAPKPEPKPAPTKAKDAQKASDAELDKTVAGKKAEDADMLSVSDVAREAGLDPKRARAKLRAAEHPPVAATEGRYPKVKRDSKTHKALVAFFKPEEPDDEDGDEGDDDEGDE